MSCFCSRSETANIRIINPNIRRQGWWYCWHIYILLIHSLRKMLKFLFFSGSQLIDLNPIAINFCNSSNNEVPEQVSVFKFQNWTEKQDCVKKKNCFQVGAYSVIKLVKTSRINEAGASVMRCCFQIEIESEIKSVETSKINDDGGSLMSCCSQIKAESNIESVETTKINDSGES